MLTAFEELSNLRQFGRACLALLLELIKQECRKFSELRHFAGSREEVENLASEFFVARGLPVTAKLVAEATDDDSVGRLLRVSVRWFLIDRVRQTDTGAMRERLDNLLRAYPEDFEQVASGQPGADRWRCVASPTDPSMTSLGELAEVAFAVRDVGVPPWTSETRRAPFADAPSIRRILIAVLSAAGGSVEIGLLTGVFIRRFPNALDPPEVSLPEDDELGVLDENADPSLLVINEVDASDAVQQASNVYRYLSDDERRLLPLLDASPHEQQAAIGRGRSQTYRHRAALIERLRALFADVQDRHAVMEELTRLCRLAESRTRPDDSPSIPLKGQG